VNWLGDDGILRFTKYERALILLFALTLPLSNPWIRGDGVGYYAFARSLLIERRLDFTQDWLRANTSFRMGRVDPDGHIRPDQFTATGRLDNHFSIGPAILWAPLLVVAHVSVLLYDRAGGKVPADGYSAPYRVAMALETALYGFLALLIGIRLARNYVPERWAFLATLGIWLGTSLPVYMTLNPSWSHAQSAFTVALFVWYWNRTRSTRTWPQWALLGALGGLAMDVYYLNVVLLALPLMESLALATGAIRGFGKFRSLVGENVVACAAALIVFSPTLIAKKLIYGSYLDFGYTERWYWNSPAILRVCFSADHGLFSWTPIVLLAVAGLFLLRRYDPRLAMYMAAIFMGYMYLIGCYQDWDGISSFGSRFFVSLTAIFVLGLAVFLDSFARWWKGGFSGIAMPGLVAAFVLWNLGLIFQWGTHLIPARGPISWRNAAYNQIAVVPLQAESVLKGYLTGRGALMNRIEEQDVNQLKAYRQQATEQGTAQAAGKGTEQ
jgi:hypothetical protein